MHIYMHTWSCCAASSVPSGELSSTITTSYRAWLQYVIQYYKYD